MILPVRMRETCIWLGGLVCLSSAVTTLEPPPEPRPLNISNHSPQAQPTPDRSPDENRPVRRDHPPRM